MGEAILGIIISNCFEVVASIISVIVATLVIPWIKGELIPWLIEKRLYNIVAVGVQAAEKLASSGQIAGIDKKNYVLNYLRKKNITITPEIETFIESVCQEMDLIGQATIEAFEVPTQEIDTITKEVE